MLAIERPASIKELMLAAEFREAEVLSNDSCSNTTGMWILGGFPPERRSKWARGCGQLSPPHPLSLTLCNSWELSQHRRAPVTGNSLGHGLLVFWKHPWAALEKAPGATLWWAGWVSAAAWVNSEERRGMSAALAAAPVGREEMCSRPRQLLESSSHFPACALPTMGSRNTAQQCDQRDPTCLTDESSSLMLKLYKRYGLFWTPALYLGVRNLRTRQAEGVYMTSLQ